MRMRLCLLAIGVLLASPPPAESHQLDEYLQATRLAFSRDRVVVELDLTPGVSVAPQVFAMIDRNGDGLVSPVEIEAYARRVLQDLSLRIDDHPYSLTLVRAESPSSDELREGVGTIRLEAFAEAPLAQYGRHHVVYENAHEPATGVYLVNALMPSTTDVTLGANRRDVRQRRIELDVDIATPFETASWLILTGGALAAVLMVRRYRGPRGCMARVASQGGRPPSRERDVDAAWREAKEGGCSDHLWTALAAKREKEHPDDALYVYQSQVEPTLNRKNNGACLMVRLDKESEFEDYIASVRAEHKPKRNFIKLLDGAKWS